MTYPTPSRRPAGPVTGLTLSRDASLLDYAAPVDRSQSQAREGAAAFLEGAG